MAMNWFKQLGNVSWTTLHIALGGITIVGGSGIFLKNIYEDKRFYRSPVIVQAIEVARQNSHLRNLLGDPIKGGKVDTNDEKNFMNETNAHFEIPLHGKVHNAMMLIDVVKEDDWILDKVNIQFKGKEKVIAQINIFKRNPEENVINVIEDTSLI